MEPSEMETEGYFTVNEFLAVFSIGRTSFYREVSLRHLQICKFGTRTLIAREEALNWAKSRIHRN